MGLKLLVIVALLVCETISSDYFETDDDGSPDVTEGSGDSNVPDVTEGSGDSNVPNVPPFPFPELPKGRTLAPRIAICYRSRHGFDPNITGEQLNAEPTVPCNETSIPGGAAGLIFSHSVLVPYFFTFVFSHF